MKTMTCKQLGGACDMEFQAETFEEMARLSKEHGTQMHEQGDEPHQKAMEKMRELMQEPHALQTWMEAKRQEFQALPEEEQGP